MYWVFGPVRPECTLCIFWEKCHQHTNLWWILVTVCPITGFFPRIYKAVFWKGSHITAVCRIQESSFESDSSSEEDWEEWNGFQYSFWFVILKQYTVHRHISKNLWFYYIQGHIYLEANEAEASEPLTCTKPFLGRGRVNSRSLERPWNLTVHIWKILDRGFPRFDNNPKNLHDITNNELWSWRKLFWTISD